MLIWERSFRITTFADLFPQRGQPAAAPFRLALVTVLQFAEGLSDRAAAEAVRGRLDWKYLLCLELEDAGFDHSVLCEFRERLLIGGAERRLLEQAVRAPTGPQAGESAGASTDRLDGCGRGDSHYESA